MDATLNSQDFAPAFHSTALPAVAAAPGKNTCSGFDGDDNDDDLLAAVDMADALSQAHAGGDERAARQQQPQAQGQGERRESTVMEEDWDEEDLAKIAEMEQSVCLPADSPTDRRLASASAREAVSRRCSGAVAAQAGGTPSASTRAIPSAAFGGGGGVSDATTMLRGENKVLRDRQTANERRIATLQEQLFKQGEALRKKERQEDKQIRDTIEKLTTTLQFKDRENEELRRDNERLAVQRAAVAAQPPLPAVTTDSGFPTVTSFHSQSAGTAAVKRTHVATAKRESDGDSAESAAKRRRTTSPRTAPASPHALALGVSPLPPPPLIGSAAAAATITPAEAYVSSERSSAGAGEEGVHNLMPLPGDLLLPGHRHASHPSLLGRLLQEPCVCAEVQQVCQSLGVQEIDVIGILEVSSSSLSSSAGSLSSSSSSSSSASSSMSAEVLNSGGTDDPFAITRHGDAATLRTSSPAVGKVKPLSRVFGPSHLAASEKSRLLQNVLTPPTRVSTPAARSMVSLASRFDSSLSAIGSAESDERHLAVALWLSRIERRLSALCQDLMLSSDSTPDLLASCTPSASQQLPQSSFSSAAPDNSGGGLLATAAEGRAKQLTSSESVRLQRTVELLCLLDHLLKCSLDACVMIAMATPALVADSDRKSSLFSPSASTGLQNGGAHSPKTPRGSPSPYVPAAATAAAATAAAATAAAAAAAAAADHTSSESAVTPAAAAMALTAEPTRTPHGLLIRHSVMQESDKINKSGQTFVRSSICSRLFCKMPSTPSVSAGGAGIAHFQDRAAARVLPSPWRLPALSRATSANDLGLAAPVNTRLAAPLSTAGSGDASPACRTAPSPLDAAARHGNSLALPGRPADGCHGGAFPSVATVSCGRPMPGGTPVLAAAPLGKQDVIGGGGGLSFSHATCTGRTTDIACRLKAILLRLLACKQASELPLSIVAASAMVTVSQILAPGSGSSSDVRECMASFVQELLCSGALHRGLVHIHPAMRVQTLRLVLELCFHPVSLECICLPDGCLLKLVYTCMSDASSLRAPQLALQCLLRLLSCHGNKALSLLLLHHDCSCSRELLRALVSCMRNTIRVFLTGPPGTYFHQPQGSSEEDNLDSPPSREVEEATAMRHLVLRQAITIFHTVILSFDHASALQAHFDADLALSQSYTAIIYQLKQYFERPDLQDSTHKMMESSMLTAMWDFLTECGSPNQSSIDTGSSEEEMTS